MIASGRGVVEAPAWTWIALFVCGLALVACGSVLTWLPSEAELPLVFYLYALAGSILAITACFRSTRVIGEVMIVAVIAGVSTVLHQQAGHPFELWLTEATITALALAAALRIGMAASLHARNLRTESIAYFRHAAAAAKGRATA